MGTHPEDVYLALVMAGLEHVAAAEIQEQLGVACTCVGVPPEADQWVGWAGSQVFAGLAGVGKLRFALPRCVGAASEAARREVLATLKAPRCLLALVSVHSGLPFEKEACATWAANVAACSMGWEDALHTWRVHRRVKASPPTFRVSCVRDGQHAYKSVDVSRALASTVGQVLGMDAVMVDYELEGKCSQTLHPPVFCGAGLSPSPHAWQSSRWCCSMSLSSASPSPTAAEVSGPAGARHALTAT